MIWVTVLTPDTEFARNVGVQKTSLVPRDIRRKVSAISINSYTVDSPFSLKSLATYFLNLPKTVSGVIVLCDHRCAHIIRHISTPLFTIVIDGQLGGKTLHNYFGMILSRSMRAFTILAQRFDDEKYRKLLILPLRNFSAPEIAELHGLFGDGVTPDGEFNNSLDQILGRLRERQKPKTLTLSRKHYIVDAKGRFFEYGKEIHCQIETAVPPHDYLCGVTGVFRFGKRYEPARHFNVSLEGSQIDGTFRDCHGTSHHTESRSHLNMFPNDFFGAN